MAKSKTTVIPNQVFIGCPWKTVRPKYERLILKMRKKYPLSFIIIGREEDQDADDLLAVIKQKLLSSSYAVFDATTGNANVSLEFGLAEASGIDRALYFCTHKAGSRQSAPDSAIIADLAGKRRVQYKQESQLAAQLGNRIEGVEVDARRVGTLVFGKAALRDRDEEEVRGYRDALNLIHTQGAKLPVSQETIRELHRLARGSVWDAGQYKQKDTDIIERFADGRERVRFRPTRAKRTPAAMAELTDLWTDCLREKWVPPLAAMVREAVKRHAGEFRLSDIERACPGVGREWIRRVLAEMKETGEVTCQGRGPAARWRWIGNKGSTLK